MSEQKVIVQLRYIVDRPVDLPEGRPMTCGDRRIESELDSDTSFSLTSDATPDEEISVDAPVVSLPVKRPPAG